MMFSVHFTSPTNSPHVTHTNFRACACLHDGIGVAFERNWVGTSLWVRLLGLGQHEHRGKNGRD